MTKQTITNIAKNMENTKPKVVILGGVHGYDKLGVEVLTHYFHHNNPLLQLTLGNYKAVEENKKFIDFDLLKAGRGDISCTTSIEKCRAGEIHEILEQFDYVVDIHGSHVNDDLVILTDDGEETIKFAKTLGVSRGILIPKNNYLIESVPHNITLVRKVEAKPNPTKEEIAETVLMIDRIENYFTKQAPNGAFSLYTINVKDDNVIDWIIENNVDGDIVLMK